jgi:23S rRNA pseudouridine1911/1915/1917 synthase
VPDEILVEDLPEKIKINIVYSSDAYIVIDKIAGMVVHPGAGNKSGTLLNALLHQHPELKKLPRAGIVHRLDKDTSGLMVVARNEPAMQSLSEQISERSIKRIYQAFTVGRIDKSGKVEAPIGRHPKNRQKQAIIDSGREAISYYKVIENFGSYSHLEVSLETGRTHQIRVHMNHLGFPLIGDPLYGRRRRFAKNTHQKLREIIESFPRQALHAAQLSFIDPATSKEASFQSKLPSDLVELRENLLNQA